LLKFLRMVLICTLGPAAAGCVEVDARPDYDRARASATEAIGHDEIYRPGDEERCGQRCRELLAAGLTVDEAVEVALLNNPGLRSAFFAVGMARADVVQAGLLSNPSLGMLFRLPAGGGLINFEANIAQNIADLWQIPARTRAAERSLDQAIMRLARQIAMTAIDTKRAYYRAVGAARLLDIAQANLKVAVEQFELAQARLEIGAGNESDVNLARSAMLEAEVNARRQRLAAANARRELAKLLGLVSDAEQLALLDDLPERVAMQLDGERLVALAVEHRLDIGAARHSVNAAAAALEQQWAAVFPNVQIGLSLEQASRQKQGGRKILADTARSTISQGQLTAPSIQPRSARDRNKNFTIGPSLSLAIPVFDQNQAQIAKAANTYDEAVYAFETLSRGIVQDVRTAADRVATAQDMAQLYRDRLIPLAEKNLELSRDAYRAGKSSFLSVLEAQRFYLNTQQASIEALRDMAEALPALEAEVGLPLERLLANASETSTTRPTEGPTDHADPS